MGACDAFSIIARIALRVQSVFELGTLRYCVPHPGCRADSARRCKMKRAGSCSAQLRQRESHSSTKMGVGGGSLPGQFASNARPSRRASWPNHTATTIWTQDDFGAPAIGTKKGNCVAAKRSACRMSELHHIDAHASLHSAYYASGHAGVGTNSQLTSQVDY